MATCIDCIHQYCCKYDRFFGIDDVENKCNYFKATAADCWMRYFQLKFAERSKENG